MMLVFIAFGLSMDSFTISLGMGSVLKKNKIKNALWASTYFLIFHSVMLFLGWSGGVFLGNWIQYIDHWIAFFLLCFIGGNMMWESFQKTDPPLADIQHKTLLFLALATSIDALGTGLSFAFLKQDILFPLMLIGVFVFVFSFIGVFLGHLLNKFLERKAEFLGGLLLFVFGIKILIDHLDVI